ncbi:ADP-ribose pyrophosphatase YjhB, NUDIX family [Brevibacterium aurantiacum]|uniref:ADP-ribose pyrophosphatase YjhB, NUDIX family n=1 Tax=Brevibacterium aurantiacum TaxID=273384 RepID=A0A2H1IR97_BREAU|nr:NUDIX domain-containing protein [Brevibacterium aurantiacum]SMX77694.1 ADP-ribose pyrophosphatase YjhB, NUDIX family [Brevibacterium aurantiacum]
MGSVERVLAAGAVITDDAGRVLLVLRGQEPEKGCWSVPGGCAEPGETPAQTARREAWEETGLHVEIGQELWTVDVPTGDGRMFEIHDFAATITAGTLTPGDDADDARWFAPDELTQVPLTTNLLDYLSRAGIVPAR